MLTLKVDDTVRKAAKVCKDGGELRAFTNFLECGEGYVMGVDGHVLVVAPAECVGDGVKYLPGKLLTMKVHAAVQGSKDNGSITLMRKKEENVVLPDVPIDFPCTDTVMYRAYDGEVQYKVGMTGEVLKTLADVVGKDEEVVIEYRDPSVPAVLTTENKYVVFMPRMLQEGE